MRKELNYYDHNGILKLKLNSYPYISQIDEWLDWGISYEEKFGKFRNFVSSKKEYKMTVGFLTENPEDREKVDDIFSEDVKVEKNGFIEIDGWRLPCFVVEKKSSVLFDSERQVEYKVVSPTSIWTRSRMRTFNGVIDESSSGTDYGRDYTSDGRKYSYGYSKIRSVNSSEIRIDSDNSGFILSFYGPVSSPYVYLNGYPVGAEVEIEEGEQLRITSIGNDKSIYIVRSNGEKESAFYYRDKSRTPFITIGKVTEVTYRDVKFDFTTVERRTSPKWI